MQQPLRFDVDQDRHHKTFFLTYCAWLTQLPLSKHTKRSYRSRVKPFLVFLQDKNLLQWLLLSRDTQKDAVNLYVEHLKGEQQLETGSLNNVLTAIDHFYKCLGIAPTRVKRESVSRRIKPITTEEVGDLLSALRDRNVARDTALLLLVLSAGLHLRECAVLNIGDIVLEPDVSVRIASKAGAHTVVKITNPELVSVLKRVVEAGNHLPPQTPLFLTNKGERLSHAGIDYIVRRIGWTAHLELSVQRLRHTYLNHGGISVELEQSPNMVSVSGAAQPIPREGCIHFGQYHTVENAVGSVIC